MGLIDNNDYAYFETDEKSLILEICKEAIVNFHILLDKVLKTTPLTEEEFEKKYDPINSMNQKAINALIEPKIAQDKIKPFIVLIDNEYYAITNKNCNRVVKSLSRLIYLKICGNLVEKGILEPAFNSETGDFTFYVKRSNRKFDFEN